MIEDESGLSLIPLMGKTWSPVGETPLIEYNFNWERLSVIGGITLNGRIHFKVHEGTIRKEQIIEYLKQVLRHIKRHIVLLWDGSRSHKARIVNEFLEEKKDRITAFRLPPYYPKFNPVEFLWTHVKWSKMRGFCPMQLGDLRKKLNNCVRAARRRPDIVRSYFRASEIPIGEGLKSSF
ncbi:MAG: IS630 family transposase [Nitrososphaerales archaeon]